MEIYLQVTKLLRTNSQVLKTRNRWWKAGYALTIQDLKAELGPPNPFGFDVDIKNKRPMLGIFLATVLSIFLYFFSQKLSNTWEKICYRHTYTYMYIHYIHIYNVCVSMIKYFQKSCSLFPFCSVPFGS